MYLRTGKDTQEILEAEVRKARGLLERTWNRIDQKKIPYATKYGGFSHFGKKFRDRVCTEVFNKEFKKSDKQIKQQSELEHLTDWFTQIDIEDDNMPKAEVSGGSEDMSDVDTIKKLQTQIKHLKKKKDDTENRLQKQNQKWTDTKVSYSKQDQKIRN